MDKPLTILRRKQVEQRTGLKTTTIYEHMQKGDFPRSISLGSRHVGWLEHEIEEWIKGRIKISRPDADLSSFVSNSENEKSEKPA